MLAICRVDMLIDVWGPGTKKENNRPANQTKSYQGLREKGKKVMDKNETSR